MTLKMRQPAPPLVVPLVGGGSFDLKASKPSAFTMVVFYRGVFCPVCKRYLSELEARLDAFTDLGIEVVAVSMDTEERAARSKTDWGLERLRVGYDLPLDTARAWGLFITTGQNDQQLPIFSEPGLFFVEPNGALYYAAVSTAPWGRPPWDEVLGGIKRTIEMKVPARGDA